MIGSYLRKCMSLLVSLMCTDILAPRIFVFGSQRLILNNIISIINITVTIVYILNIFIAIFVIEVDRTSLEKPIWPRGYLNLHRRFQSTDMLCSQPS